MPRVIASHARAGAELRKPEATLKPRVLLRDEAVVEIDVMRDEDAVAHKANEAIRHFRKDWRVMHRFVRYACEPCDE